MKPKRHGKQAKIARTESCDHPWRSLVTAGAKEEGLPDRWCGHRAVQTLLNTLGGMEKWGNAYINYPFLWLTSVSCQCLPLVSLYQGRDGRSPGQCRPWWSSRRAEKYRGQVWVEERANRPQSSPAPNLSSTGGPERVPHSTLGLTPPITKGPLASPWSTESSPGLMLQVLLCLSHWSLWNHPQILFASLNDFKLLYRIFVVIFYHITSFL